MSLQTPNTDKNLVQPGVRHSAVKNQEAELKVPQSSKHINIISEEEGS